MNDGELRARFRAMESEEARAVPSLERVLTRRTAQPRVEPRWPVLATAAAVVALLGTTVLASRGRRNELVVPQEVMALTTWTSPTDGLLANARMHLMTEAPKLGASMLDTLNGRVQ